MTVIVFYCVYVVTLFFSCWIEATAPAVALLNKKSINNPVRYVVIPFRYKISYQPF